MADPVVDYLGPILWDYVDQAAALLVPVPSKIIHINPGIQVPWDECCEGQLAGRVISVAPIVGSRTEAASLPCGVMFWQATLGVSSLRCIAVVDDNGVFPTGPVMDSDGVLMLLDMAAIQQAVLCNPNTRTITGWTPFTAQGGCVGGEWTFTVRYPVCPCPPDAHPAPHYVP